jgi:large subunit ribosomal protein L5
MSEATDYQPRLRKRYQEEVVPALMKRFGYKNSMQVPRLNKIVVNMGLGEAVTNPKLTDAAVTELTAITGQKPVITRAKKAIATFKLRQGMPIGAMVTLRRERMWEFLDRLITLGLPRVRDFRGTSAKAFDGAGNYTLGLREQIVFPEIDFDQVEKIKGMNITVVTTARYKHTQIGGDHYVRCGIQPMEYALANNFNYLESFALKYLTRHRNKNGIEDLKKALHCIELLIEVTYEPGRQSSN